MRRQELRPDELVPVEEIAYVLVRSEDGWRAGVLLVYGERGQESLTIRWYKKIESMRRVWLSKLHKMGDLPVVTNKTMLRHVLWKHGIRGIDPKVVFGLEGN